MFAFPTVSPGGSIFGGTFSFLMFTESVRVLVGACAARLLVLSMLLLRLSHVCCWGGWWLAVDLVRLPRCFANLNPNGCSPNPEASLFRAGSRMLAAMELTGWGPYPNIC